MEACGVDKTEDQLAALLPGGVLHYDYRTASAKAACVPDRLRVVQWNIERAVKFDSIVRTLRAIQADIIFLQEVEINSPLSGRRNMARELAGALQMQLYFVCEFKEFDVPEHASASPSLRGPNINEKGDKEVLSVRSEKRWHRFRGNALLSACANLSDPFVIKHASTIGPENTMRQESHGLCQGFRCALRCRINRSERTSPLLPDLYLYSCHFELYCGMPVRVRQLLDVLRDATILFEQKKQSAFIIGGDFSTMGLTRLAGNDRLYFIGLGEKEACWLQRKVLSRRMERVVRGCCPFSYRFPYYISSLLYNRVCNSDLVLQLLYGFSPDEVADLDNRRLCFYDPSDKLLSVTAKAPAYPGLRDGKSDWLLLSNMLVVPPELTEEAVAELQGGSSITLETASCLRQQRLPCNGYVLFNERFEASSHKGLLLQVQQNVGFPQETYPVHGAVYTSSLHHLCSFSLTRALPLVAVVAAVWLFYKRRW